MEILLLLLLVLVMGAVNVTCFVIGAKVGKATAKSEEVKLMPVVHDPLEAAQMNQVQNEAEGGKSQLETILQNINNYDGTEQGQEDVPWR